MDPRGGGPPPDDSPALGVDNSDSARVAQATGMVMERYELDAHRALALLIVLAWLNGLGLTSVARELVEHRP